MVDEWKQIPYGKIKNFVPPYCSETLEKMSAHDSKRCVAFLCDIIGRMIKDKKKEEKLDSKKE